MHLQDFNYNGSIIQRRPDGFISLTQMCQANGKRIDHWKELKATKAYIEVLESKYPGSRVIDSELGINGGTWGHPGLAINLARWISPQFAVWCDDHIFNLMETGSTSLGIVKTEPVSQFIEPDVITAELEAIKFFTGNGDLQLAQLAKCHLGNRYLASQQKLLKPVDVPQYEGVIDVAIRLGFNVPSNYESALGGHVAKQLKHLAIGQDKRYSTASSKQIGANMYPAGDPDVEKAVLDYCVSKSFYRREMNWIN